MLPGLCMVARQWLHRPRGALARQLLPLVVRPAACVAVGVAIVAVRVWLNGPRTVFQWSKLENHLPFISDVRRAALG